MYQEEKIWFSQSLMFHRDQLYNTNSSLDLTIYSSTIDYKSYSPISFKITIVDNALKQSRFVSLSYASATELLSCIKNATEDLGKKVYTSGKIIVQKKFYDKTLNIEFSRISEQMTASINILQNGDTGLIIIPYSIFNAFGILIKSYINDFIKLNIEFVNRAVLIDILDQTKSTKNLIKILPSSIERQVNIPEVKEVTSEVKNINSEESKEPTSEIECETTDFDKFMESNLDLVKIPELERLNKTIESENKEPIKTHEINSNFIFNVLNGDLYNFESMINSAITSGNVINALHESILPKLNVNDGFTFLPGIKPKEYNSLVFLSKCLYLNFFLKYINHNLSIPSSIQVLKYKPESGITEDNINLAYDILLISCYIKCLRTKLSSKEQDSRKNKSVFYLGIRTLTDSLSLGILESIDPKIIKTCIMERFKYYSSKDVFKTYEELLGAYNITIVSEQEISAIISEMTSKVFGRPNFILEMHKKFNDEKFIRLRHDNNLNLEQIVQECIPLQVSIIDKVSKTSNDEEVNNVITTLKDTVSKEVLNEFKLIGDSSKRERVNHLVRAASYYNTDVPERFKDKFIQYISSLTGDYDFNSTDFPVEEIGEGMLKSLYIWNEGGRYETYTDFMTKISECAMDKILILAKYKVKEETSTEEWGEVTWG